MIKNRPTSLTARLASRTLLAAIIMTNTPVILAAPLNHKEAQIENILSALSLEEKAGQLNLIPLGEPVSKEHLALIKEGKVGSVLKSHGAAHNLKLQKIAVEESKSGVPLMFQEDVIHGYKTISPVPLAEAASWDLEAIRKSAEVAAREASASGIQLTYAPMVDVSREPRWGRILEGAGEDPYLASLIAAARVRGFQESGEKHQTLLSTAKHFVGYGASLAGRDYNIRQLSERELREIHLPPFQAAINANVSSVMTAYTAYNGIPATAHKPLLQDLLRKEMGFDGLIMTDWDTITNLIKIGVAKDDEAATLASIDAGVEMDMFSQKYQTLLPKLVREGKVSEQQLDNAVRRVLQLKQRAGLLDDPFQFFDEDREKSEHLSQANLDAVLDVTLKSMVLLKNDEHTLPIKTGIKSIAVIGPLAKSQRDLMGWWHGRGDESDVVSIYSGLKNTLDDSIKLTYAQGVRIDKFKPAGEELIAPAVQTATESDLVIMVLGEEHWMSGEGGGTASIRLPGLQEQLLQEVAKTGKPIVTVIVTGKPYILTDVAKHSDALLQAWMPGTTGGTAVAKILSGDYNPSGKLPITFPYHQGQTPIFYNYKRSSHPFDAGPNDNRYSATYRDIPSEPLYPFGYGLSYSTFTYSDIKLSNKTMQGHKPIKASVKVTNTSDIAGREIVQLYIRDQVASVVRPIKSLRGFKLLDLKAKESQIAEFEITQEDLAFIGRDYQKTVEAGEFTVYIGASSSDFKQASFDLEL